MITMNVLKSITHPDEIVALFKYQLGWNAVTRKQDTKHMSVAAKRCYEYLNQTGRSFAAVVNSLDGDLRHAVRIFYLVLRALDTVEDDMTIPVDEKSDLLVRFYTKLEEPEWTYNKSQEKHRIVLEDFTSISKEYRGLASEYRVVISDICQKMGQGMFEFLHRDVITIDDWNLYCHYVAGLVAIGLSRLFSASELEDTIVDEDTELVNSVGLFLQKTNIIRDYWEDMVEGREFWPKETWSKYADTLSDFQKHSNIHPAVSCLNDLITNALHHVPDVLEYMSRIKNQSVFNFFAINEVMGITTLAACYNNPNVFSGVVKIRKGQAVSLTLKATNMSSIKSIMYQFASQIQQTTPKTDPSAEKTLKITNHIKSLCTMGNSAVTTHKYSYTIYGSVACNMVLVAMTIYTYWDSIAALYSLFKW
ncbi:squalene synthase-like [Amphiura filiformis]|uniref:squalene synthase-like n=1 Tax=Amphiura filiformis TaxID=82378 RepID=UPI003B217440